MADAVDFANDLVLYGVEKTLAARTVFSGVSLAVCEKCGSAIPVLRQQAVPGVRLCVCCQLAVEKRGRV